MDAIPLDGIATLFAGTDAVGRGILAALLLMSIASWTVILGRLLAARRERRRRARFLAAFWNASSLEAAESSLAQDAPEEPLRGLARAALAARRHHRLQAGSRLSEAGTDAEFLTRALRRALDDQAARMESGLTLLASVGSTAPFVGLFGTVWGVYHALVAIGTSGQGTLERIAGPVGEALVMTALGLVVAIPAVLAYNAFARANRLARARLDGFAHDLFTLLTTGAPLAPRAVLAGA